MESTTPDVSERLAHTYTYWQVSAMIYETLLKMKSKSNFVPPEEIEKAEMSRNLAYMIMDNSVPKLLEQDWRYVEEFATVSPVVNSLKQHYLMFPYELFLWNRRSRRSFHLPHKLVAALSAASLKEMKWGDVLWPHESFVITLEKPFVIKEIHDNTEYYDSILVTMTTDEKNGRLFLTTRLFQAPIKPNIRVGFTKSQMDRFVTLLRREKWGKAIDLCEDMREQMINLYHSMPGSSIQSIQIDPDRPIRLDYDDPEVIFERLQTDEEILEANPEYKRYYDAKGDVGLVMFRIVIGWALYLETLSPDRKSVTKAQQTPKRLSGGHSGIITSPDEIFSIKGSGVLKSGGDTCRRSLEDGGFVRPHWRRAHKRRPQGSLPDAPKTIKVPQKLIREDLVPLFGIIGGTRSVMFLED